MVINVMECLSASHACNEVHNSTKMIFLFTTSINQIGKTETQLNFKKCDQLSQKGMGIGLDFMGIDMNSEIC